MTSRGMRVAALAAAAVGALVAIAAPAAAAPVATSDEQYAVLGRVFPDPLAGCQHTGTSPCDPNAQGNVQADTFIQIDEFVEALTYMNQHDQWSRYMEVLVLDGQIGHNGNPEAPGKGSGPADDELGVGDPGDDMFPGNTLPLDFDPKPEFKSAGLPTSTMERERSDLIVVRVTDENVPDENKKRYALSLSIHGIERAGAEGGTRAMEDLVTAATTETLDDPIVPDAVKEGAPTFEDVLQQAVIYFTYPNPDGWRRGSYSNLVPSFQRYNGNGVDPNRDWPDIGYAFRPYSAASEPETRAFISFYEDIEENAGQFTAGDDLHGQPDADALSYTLLPHGSKDFAKDLRAREVSKRINSSTYEAIKWHPRIQENDEPRCGGKPDTGTPDPFGLDADNVLIVDDCPMIYAQTWGTVYDTINYTTTGALGDWFDSPVGLGADGIDNEMSFSHLDRDTLFEKTGEQLHVQGNKALIYARITEILDPPDATFDAPGLKGYVANERVTREEQDNQPAPPENTVAQDTIETDPKTVDESGNIVFPFEVKRSEPHGETPGIYNGGMNVTITSANVQGEASGYPLSIFGIPALEVQCRGCDEHPGTEGDDGWITVAEDFNQSPIYRQAGLIASVNRPQAFDSEGNPVEWRAVVNGESVAARMRVEFTQGPATDNGATGGDEPPKLAAYDVANTDFFPDLNPYIPEGGDFEAIDPAKVIAGEQSLDGLTSLVLADDPLPGYTGPYGDAPTGTPSADFEFAHDPGTQTQPGFYLGFGPRVPNSYETEEFTIPPEDVNERMTIRIEWADSANDFDLYLYRKAEDGSEQLVDNSAQGGTDFEEITVPEPAAGDYVIYVDNWSSADSEWTGTVRFTGPPASGGTGDFTVEQKDAWFAAVRDFVAGGGNLVLTDGALRALPELTGIPTEAVRPRTVYVGQMTFDLSGEEGDETIDDPLVTEPVTINQQGARYNDGFRRQTFEPTPLGFAIQTPAGLDDSNARQYDVDREAFEEANGRVVATSVGTSDAGDPVYDRVTLGELELGEGRVRIAGALLPQPTEEFDHTFGLEPYAVTYTGYILMRNLLEP